MFISELQNIPKLKLAATCLELRNFLIESILKSGGHFSANLGVVELTVALHYVFRSPHDKIIWDVGHQAYLHKALTGRWEELKNIRKTNGISGFPKIHENENDAFGTGHSSTSISSALGYAISAKNKKLKRQHIAVIGDGSLTGGLAFEGLLNAASSETNLSIIINDNQMSIDAHEGSLAKMLQNIDPKKNFFTEMGFEYFGPEDGHNVLALIELFTQTKQNNKPKILHIKTIKGKGYKAAEEEKSKWHSVKYVKVTTEKLPSPTFPKFQDVFGKTLLELAEKNPKIYGITPAMPSGSSFHFMMEKYPERCLDVGIAEQHAVTFSAGLAVDGNIPFCGIYSSFLQRAYDQIIHDVCLQNIPVIFCIDRAGIVGEDGPTHHGIFDISFLQCIPNLKIWCPMNASELKSMIIEGAKDRSSPIAIRYPKGRCYHPQNMPSEKDIFAKPDLSKSKNRLLVISTGIVSSTIRIIKRSNWDHIHIAKIKPLPVAYLTEVINKYDIVLIFEEGSVVGGFGSEVIRQVQQKRIDSKIYNFGIEDKFLTHGSREELLKISNLDEDGILKTIKSHLK